MAKHAANPGSTDTDATRSERMATIMDLTVEQLRDMLLTLAIEEPAIFDTVRFAAL